jgi:hypothetical protein
MPDIMVYPGSDQMSGIFELLLWLAFYFEKDKTGQPGICRKKKAYPGYYLVNGKRVVKP